MIHLFSTYNNLLSINEIDYLEEKIKNFKSDEEPLHEKGNSYYRHFIDNNSEFISDYINKINFIFKNRYYKHTCELIGIWINKIGSDDYQIEEFHNDESDISTITFLNENFEGGDFIYLNSDNSLKLNSKDNEKKVIPKKNTTIIFEGNLIPHKVSKVTKGNRYSLVTFWKVIQKNEKSLI